MATKRWKYFFLVQATASRREQPVERLPPAGPISNTFLIQYAAMTFDWLHGSHCLLPIMAGAGTSELACQQPVVVVQLLLLPALRIRLAALELALAVIILQTPAQVSHSARRSKTAFGASQRADEMLDS